MLGFILFYLLKNSFYFNCTVLMNSGIEVGGREFGLHYTLGPNKVFIRQKILLLIATVFTGSHLNTFHPEPLKSDSLHIICT